MNSTHKKITIFILAVLALGSGVFYAYQRGYFHSSSKNFVDEVRNENKPMLDSLQAEINNERKLSRSIEKAIKSKEFETALKLIDSLPPFGKAHIEFLYKGMIFEEQEKYEKAIEEYSKAIEELPYSKAKSLRANVYRKLNMFETALAEYKEIYQYNHFFSFHIGEIYRELKQKDSALKYYKIYSGHYPSDTLAIHWIRSLSN